MQCAPAEVLLKALTDGRYQEKALIQGSMGEGKVLRWYVNTETQTWTLVLLSGKAACILASGIDFRTIVNDVVGEPS